ncbi:MAG: MFS transporter [Agriterribacter sp.]
MSESGTKNYRWIISIFLFTATTINYIDRQIFGLLKPELEKVFSWSETDYSKIIMAFTACYAIGQLVYGRIIDAIGTKKGYTISVTIWSIAAMLHTAVKSTLGFAVVRGLLGIGESGNYPAGVKTTAEWFPKKERAFAIGIFDSGSNIGACVARCLCHGYWQCTVGRRPFSSQGHLALSGYASGWSFIRFHPGKKD